MARMTRKDHRRRIRRHARKLSWTGAPAVLATMVLWLSMRALMCWGGTPGRFENAACQTGFGAPVLAVAITLFFIGLLMWALADFGATAR